jgi:hypothetical protein
MTTRTRADRKDSKSVTISLTPSDHARLLRHAPAHAVKNNKYAQLAIRFFMDCEDAFAGPLNEQFRAMLVRDAKGLSQKLAKLLNNPKA